MWKDILKVDRFSRLSRGAKGTYASKDDAVTIDLDNFLTASRLYGDDDRITEFSNVVTHELSHREYQKELGSKMNESLKQVYDSTEEYKMGNASIEDIEKKLLTFIDYVITNEMFAFSSGKSTESMRHTDTTKSSIRSVLTQVFDKIREIKNNKQIDKLLDKVYRESMRRIRERR
tara:strand:- start:1078 stop:1602 length:525 start_codon:yes stop_codon:yes gene_type:complete